MQLQTDMCGVMGKPELSESRLIHNRAGRTLILCKFGKPGGKQDNHKAVVKSQPRHTTPFSTCGRTKNSPEDMMIDWHWH